MKRIVLKIIKRIKHFLDDIVEEEIRALDLFYQGCA